MTNCCEGGLHLLLGARRFLDEQPSAYRSELRVSVGVKQHINRATAGWIAVLLEHAGVIQIDRSRPPAYAWTGPYDLIDALPSCSGRWGRPGGCSGWTRKVQADRATVLARSKTSKPAGTRLTEVDIQQRISALGDLAAVIKDADPVDKARIYTGLKLRLTYEPGQQLIRAEARLAAQDFGAMGRVRGGIDPISPRPRLVANEDITLRQLH